MAQAFGKYQLVRKLATGGMAEVFLAQVDGPAGFQKTLVVKRILPHLAEDENFIQMFLNEARLAASLNHPNVLTIFDLGEEDGAYFIAMEYIDGPNLRILGKATATAGKSIDVEHAAKIVSLACEGLGYAHDYCEGGRPLDLIHRDISPDNILISRTGAVKVVDFGIAKAANQSHLTKTGTLKGKLAYMAPEQLRGDTLDRRADIFSMGVVLYELLAGMKPFDSTSEVASMQAILFEPPRSLLEKRPDCPVALLKVVDRALHKDRDQRYPDCRSMQRDLDRFLIDRSSSVGAFELAQFVAEIMPAKPAASPAAKPIPADPGPSECATQVAVGVARDPEVVDAASLATVIKPAGNRPSPEAKPLAVADPLDESDPVLERGGHRGLIVAAIALVLLGAGGYALFGRDATAPAEPTLAPTSSAPTAVQPFQPPARPEQPAATRVEPKPPVVAEPAKPPETALPVEPAKSAEPVKAMPVESAEPVKAAPVKIAEPVKAVPVKSSVPVRSAVPVKSGEPVRSVIPAASREPAVAATATLIVETDPPCAVSIAGKPFGTSPVTARGLAAGAHEVEISNAEKGLKRRLGVILAAGETKTEKVKFATGTIVLRIRPWANVEVDGKNFGPTPLPNGITVYEGQHKVRLSNPDLGKELVRMLWIGAGKEEVIKANLAE